MKNYIQYPILLLKEKMELRRQTFKYKYIQNLQKAEQQTEQELSPQFNGIRD